MDLLFPCHVRDKRVHISAKLRGFRSCLLELGFITPDERQSCSVSSKFQRDGLTQPATCPGDQCYTAFKSFHVTGYSNGAHPNMAQYGAPRPPRFFLKSTPCAGVR